MHIDAVVYVLRRCHVQRQVRLIHSYSKHHAFTKTMKFSGLRRFDMEQSSCIRLSYSKERLQMYTCDGVTRCHGKIHNLLRDRRDDM